MKNTFDYKIDSRLKLLHQEFNEIELKKIHYKDLKIMGEFLKTALPKSKSVNVQNSLLVYISEILKNKKNINDRKYLSNLVNTHLSPVSRYLEKYGFREKGVWLIFYLPLLILEILILVFLIKGVYLPILSTLFFLVNHFIDKQKNQKGKLLRTFSTRFNVFN